MGRSSCARLKQQGKRHWYTVAPMLFVSGVTLTSLVLQVKEAFFSATTATPAQRVYGVVAVLLFALAASLLTTGARALLKPTTGPLGLDPSR